MESLEQLLSELDELSRQPVSKAKQARLTKVKELLGEIGAKNEVVARYGASRLKHMSVPRRGNEGAVILDLLFQLDDGQFVLVEAKYGVSQMGRTTDRRTFLVTTMEGKVEKAPLNLKRQIEQLDALWIKDRIAEIDKTDAALAKALGDAVKGGQLKVLEVRSRVDLEAGKPLKLSSQVTEHTERFREQAKVGRRFVDEERRFARREALGERELKRLAAKTKELEKAAKDARKAEKSAQKALDRSKKKLAGLKHTPGKPLTKSQVAARQRWADAIADQEKALAKSKGAVVEADAALARHREVVDTVARQTESDGLARKAEEKYKRLQEAERLQSGAASGKLDEAARARLDKRVAPAPERPQKAVVTEPRPDKPAGTPTSPSPVGDKAVGSTMVADKGLDNAATAHKGLTSQETAPRKLVVAANELGGPPRVPVRGRAAQLGLKGLKVVAKVGRFAFSLLNFANPVFNLLDAVALVDRLVAWLRREQVEEQKEWARIGAYIFSHPQVVRTAYGVSYYTGMGNHVDAQARVRMADARFPDNALFWTGKWSDPRWPGFVYLTVDAGLERQESNQGEDPYQVKYYMDAVRIESFSDNPPPNAKTKQFVARVGAQDERNRSSEGRQPPYSSPEYNIEVEISMLKVRCTYPQPYLTPFDFMIMKCNHLIASIVEFASRYDAQVVEGMSVSDEVVEGVRAYWLENYAFPAPLNSGAVHRSLLNLLEAVRVLSLHAHGAGDSRRAAGTPQYNSGYMRRREILTKLYANNPKLRGMRPFYFLQTQLAQLLSKDQLSRGEDQDIDALVRQAADIEADLKRTLDRCKAPATALAFNYEGKVGR